MNPRIKKVLGCIIIDKLDEVNDANIDIQKILSIHGDKTGYEAAVNEVRLNDYVEEVWSYEQLIDIGWAVLERWGTVLKETYRAEKFCLIMGCNAPYVTIRFHQIRDNEAKWLSEDLELYNELIAVKEI